VVRERQGIYNHRRVVDAMEVSGGGPQIKLGEKTAQVRLKLCNDGWRVVDKRTD